MPLLYQISAENATVPPSILGLKALSLCRMMTHALNVPHGFVFQTELSRCYDNNQEFPASFDSDLKFSLRELELRTHKIFGDTVSPLWVSVRSGAAISMPGMMDSLLNIGMTLAYAQHHDAYIQYAEFMVSYATMVDQIYLDEDAPFALSTPDKSPELVAHYLETYQHQKGHPFPQNPMVQIRYGIEAVLKSVHNRRAKTYQHLHHIRDEDMATAVIVQQMILGNATGFSGSGIANSRNPNTGMPPMMGEFILHHQGDMIASGRKTPQNLQHLQEQMPHLYDTLKQALSALETAYQAPVEIEFTIENGILWFLQVRSLKISPEALLTFITELIEAGKISVQQGMMLVEPTLLERFLHPHIDDRKHHIILDKGIAASPGAAVGHLVFTATEAVQYAAEEKPVILARHETSPEDIYGMYAANGVLTARGGMTSHAAVAARGMGRPCVTGLSKIKINIQEKTLQAGDRILKTGDMISMNGTTGDILLGAVRVCPPSPPACFYRFNDMAQNLSRMGIRTNIDSLAEAKLARQFQTTGIGLYRTEYALYTDHELQNIRRMVIAETEAERRDIAETMKPSHVDHFTALFDIMEDLPVTIRLFDPPLHEFFSDSNENMHEIAKKMGMREHDLRTRLQSLKEFNPMLGIRGCRIGILNPDIYEFQISCILHAMQAFYEQRGVYPNAEIMLPFVGFVSEFTYLKNQMIQIWQQMLKAYPLLPLPKMGAMIELPRAALCADKLALEADFISFGTNDLTQTVLGISRDDSPRFLQDYLRKKLIPFDPFIQLDLEGVGMLIAIAVQKARLVKKNIPIGLCGEHGADPACVDFCEMLKLDYVSCSPYRMPTARLAAVRSFIKAGGK